MKNTLEIGKKYGHLTVISEDARGKHGERRLICRCDCGNVDSFILYPVLQGRHTHCRKCAPHAGGMPPPDLVGQTINGWEVLEEISREPKGTGKRLDYLYRCRCQRCHNESIKRPGELRRSRSNRCSKCTPMYFFRIMGEAAEGTLPDGTSFFVDAEDIPKVETQYWSMDGEGYVVSSNQHIRLHRYLLNVSDPSVMVDHINRNRKDNRKANLRVISTFGNSCNHSMLSSNKTGFIGVYYSRHSQRYEVKVGYHGKRIKLGSSKDDLIRLAQMYNEAAKYLFGEFVGELNDVPVAPPEVRRIAIEKCQKYKKASAPSESADAKPKEAA